MRTSGRIVLLGIVGIALGTLRGPARAQEKPTFQRAADALERVTWRTRTLVGDERLTDWKFAIRVDRLTFLESIIRADAAIVNFVEGSSTQRMSPETQKNLDHNLTPEEIAAVRARMGTIRMLTYRIPTFGDPPTRRRIFAFAQAMGADILVAPFESDLAMVDALAAEFDVKVALIAPASTWGALMKALESRSKRLGVAVDTGLWAQDGVSPGDGLAAARHRVLYFNLRDRSARGEGARNVPLGTGVANMPELFHALNRRNMRPLALTLDTADIVKEPADLFAAVEAFEAVVQPAYGAYFTEFSKSRPIRWDVVTPARGETLPPETIEKRAEDLRQRIEAAIPRQAYAAPKKPRRLLVIESLHGMSHTTIPHTNVMLGQLGKITGAWTPVFDNDLTNLKYPKIKEYDGVFLNSTVGELFPDLEVREGLARFVREGGGLGGVHGTPWASRNWEEFAEMIGAQSAPHRIEQGVMKVYDPASPLMKPFGGNDLNLREEYYRFEHEGRGRLRWDKVRVLLTVDLDDPRIEPRPWSGYKRPDNIYPVTWIRRYGEGRVFYCSLGHMPETFMTPEIVGHFLAGIQFLLGDLAADTTPNPRPAASGM
jgi:hypothetical protein